MRTIPSSQVYVIKKINGVFWVLLHKRPQKNKKRGGAISFAEKWLVPGGTFDERFDINRLGTAQREFKEEVGKWIHTDEFVFVGDTSLEYKTSSEDRLYLIRKYAVLAKGGIKAYEHIADPNEVAAAQFMPIAEALAKDADAEDRFNLTEKVKEQLQAWHANPEALASLFDSEDDGEKRPSFWGVLFSAGKVILFEKAFEPFKGSLIFPGSVNLDREHQDHDDNKHDLKSVLGRRTGLRLDEQKFVYVGSPDSTVKGKLYDIAAYVYNGEISLEEIQLSKTYASYMLVDPQNIPYGIAPATREFLRRIAALPEISAQAVIDAMA